MDGRFHRRLTVVTAGAGFGKTTLLRQALLRNRDSLAGEDRWLACRPLHVRPAEFAAALRSAVGCRHGEDDVVEAVCAEIWRQSPADVALLVDDVHLLPPGGESATLLQHWLDRLPANAHLVLSGRRGPPLRTARLEAAGDAVHLNEKDLAFTGEEQTEFLAMRAPDQKATDVGGWPALLELSVSSSSARVGDFVWEEVLHSLAPDHARGLARLLALDWVDDHRIAAFVGAESGLDAVIEQLPLCHRDEDGRVQIHALWERMLVDVDPEWDASSVATASTALADGGWYREALELCVGHGTEVHVDALVHRYAAEEVEHLPSEQVETFLHLLPEVARRSRFGCFLDGRLQTRRRPKVAKPLLEEARKGFSAHGEASLEVITLALLGQIAFSEWKADTLGEIAARAREIATPAALGLASMMDATRLTVEGAAFDRVRLAIEKARAVGVPLGGAEGVAAGVASRLCGVPGEGLAIVEEALRTATQANMPLLRANQFDLQWLEGKIGNELLAMLDAGPDVGLAEMTHQAAGVSAVMAFSNAVAGRTRQARRHLERADAFRSQTVRHGLAMPDAARMALAISDGREDIARGIAEDGIDESMMADPGIRRAMPMALLVSEQLRAQFEGIELGSCYDAGRTAVEALLTLRETDDCGAASALPWSDSSRFTIYLVPPLVLELALAATVGGNRDAVGVARDMASQDRRAVRGLAANGPSSIRGKAAQLLKDVPARPDGSLEIRTLGPFELRSGGEVVDAAALRRGKVRAMLQYLVGQGSCRREELGVALWPDFDEQSMANNLRVTLSHATKLLEPEREKGEPAYRLRVNGDRVELHLDEALTIDIHEFEELLDAADVADRAGHPARTLALLDRAVDMYDGHYLDDAPEPAWGEAERARLRHRFVRSALRSGELQLGQGDLDAARERAVRARAADPYCEAAARLEALVYLRKGDRASARAVLGGLLVDLDDAGVIAEPETAALLRRSGAADIRTQRL